MYEGQILGGNIATRRQGVCCMTTVVIALQITKSRVMLMRWHHNYKQLHV